MNRLHIIEGLNSLIEASSSHRPVAQIAARALESIPVDSAPEGADIKALDKLYELEAAQKATEQLDRVKGGSMSPKWAMRRPKWAQMDTFGLPGGKMAPGITNAILSEVRSHLE